MTLTNPSFERGWTTDARGNQAPHGWRMLYYAPGTPLMAPKAGAGDTQDYVLSTPECVHKLSEQLPDDEKLGGKDALILDGNVTFKPFGKNAFRLELEQLFTVPAGKPCTLVVPVQVHGEWNDATDAPWNIDTGSAYWRVSVNGEHGKWNTFNNDYELNGDLHGFDDRTWLYYTMAFVAPSGTVDMLIEFENHGESGIAFFIDNVQFFVQNDVPEPVECKGLPRVQYERVYNLLPQNATIEQFVDIAKAVHYDKETVGFSADDAGLGSLDVKRADVWWFDEDSWESEKALNDFFARYYPGTSVKHVYNYSQPPPVDPPVEPPVDPPPGWTPTNYVPTGCKVNWHGVGDDGQTEIQQDIMARGATMATAKGLADVGWCKFIKLTDGNTRTVGRFIDNENGVNVEWFDNNRDPIQQARNRMNNMSHIFGVYNADVDYWEIMNEEDPPGSEGHINLAHFFIEAMNIANIWDVKLALFSYSMGVPEPFEWDAIATTGIFELAARTGHAISLHEYGVWPRDQISLLTRYRYVYEKHILPNGYDIPLFITEYAPDAWTLDAFSDDDLMAQIAAYDNELAKDPYVAGAHIFTVGGASGWGWFRDRWVRLYGRYEDYAVSVKERANG